MMSTRTGAASTPAKRSDQRALVLFSGGQDSTVCLAWALTHFAHVETLGFDYGQRHRVELQARQSILQRLREEPLRNAHRVWPAKLGPDHVLELPLLGQLSETALTREMSIQMQADGLPNTFVPGRNLLFLNVAAILAYRRQLSVLVGGMCETDFSGYPDCRDDTIKAMQVGLSLGLDKRLTIETPLMWLDKADTWALTQTLGGEALVELVRRETHTCYLGERGALHAWGHGCGQCPACHLRQAGYERWMHTRNDSAGVHS